MKTLYYRVHSFAGTDGHLTKEGRDRAMEEGSRWNKECPPTKFFYSSMLPTLETASAFAEGMNLRTARFMGAIPEMGNEDWLKDMLTDSARAAVERGQTRYLAVVSTCAPDDQGRFADIAMSGLRKAFAQMDDGETAFAFGHSPIIELACAILPELNRPQDRWFELGELDGMVFHQRKSVGILSDQIIRLREYNRLAVATVEIGKRLE